jgi:hypothetical protein
MPVRQPSKPAFIPDNSNMARYVKPMSRQEALGF